MGARLRFRRLPEDADDGDVSVCYREPDRVTWTCHVCNTTRGNTGEWRACLVCNQVRGAWPCECGHVNNPDSESCETCGRERPEEYVE